MYTEGNLIHCQLTYWSENEKTIKEYEAYILL